VALADRARADLARGAGANAVANAVANAGGTPAP